MRLWDKGGDLDAAIAAFTVGDDPVVDLAWAWHDVVGSAAHVRVIRAAGLLDDAEARVLIGGLSTIAAEIEAGTFTIPAAEEDVHTAVEARLTERLGPVAGKLHTGRSRNDQVLTTMRLWTLEQIDGARSEWTELACVLLDFARRNLDVPLTGYTHLQRAMPSSYGQWAAGFAGALLDAQPLLDAAEQVADRCPLGSAAGYGSPLPLDRALSARLLGFRTVEEPATACQLTRGLVEGAVLGALGAATGLVGRLAWDISLYCSAEFGLLRLPTAFTTGSSIMPQKRNPDVAELLRASAVTVRAARREIEDIVALPSGYHRDVQLTKAAFQRGLLTARRSLSIAARLVGALEAAPRPLAAELFAAAEATLRSAPFREAYREVGQEIAAGTFLPSEAALATRPPLDLDGLTARCPAKPTVDRRARWSALLRP
jgi:argininosuccinate lyase